MPIMSLRDLPFDVVLAALFVLKAVILALSTREGSA